MFGAAIHRAEAEEEGGRIQVKLKEPQKLESLGVLEGGIAHDFNNLLTSILGNASLARMELPPISRADYSLQQVEGTSLRAAELCKQMLAYAGKGRFVLQTQDLIGLFKNIIQLIRLSLSKKASIDLELAPGLPQVMADDAQVRQIVVNTVINASGSIGHHAAPALTPGKSTARTDAAPASRTTIPHCIPGRTRYNLRAMTAPIIVLWVYIVLLEVGGLVGFLKAGSKASLIASSVFALPLILVALGILPAVVADAVLGVLLGYMSFKFAKSKKFMPSGLMAILSAVALALRFLLNK